MFKLQTKDKRDTRFVFGATGVELGRLGLKGLDVEHRSEP